MKNILILFFFLFSLNSFCQNINRIITDEKTGKEILIGSCNKQGLMQLPYSDWFNKEYEAYVPDRLVLSQLKPFAGSWAVLVIMGTWCHDSHQQVPRFIKTIESAGFLPGNLKILSVDTQKKCDEADIPSMNIERVPTFIIYNGDKEIGRIIETPKITLETDLLNILQNQ